MLVFAVFVAGQQGAETAGETYNHPEAPSGEWRHTECPCSADRPCHSAASHPGAGASARRGQEQPLPPNPPQHQIGLYMKWTLDGVKSHLKLCSGALLFRTYYSSSSSSLIS